MSGWTYFQLRAGVPMSVRSAQECPAKDEFAWTHARYQGQHVAGHIGGAEGVTVEEAFDLADDGRGLSASREALSQFGVPDIFRLKERDDDQGQQLHLVLAVVRKVSGEAATQLSECNGRHILLSRVRQNSSSLSRNFRVQGNRKVGRPSAPVQEPTGADSKNPDFIARRSSPEFAVNRILTASSTLRWPCYTVGALNVGGVTYSTVTTVTNQTARTITVDGGEWTYSTKATTLGGNITCTQSANGSTTVLQVSANVPLKAGWNFLKLHADGAASSDGSTVTINLNFVAADDRATTWSSASASPLGMNPLASSVKARLSSFRFGNLHF